MAILSVLEGFPLLDKIEVMLPRAIMKAMLAEKPVGHKIQLCRRKACFKGYLILVNTTMALAHTIS